MDRKQSMEVQLKSDAIKQLLIASEHCVEKEKLTKEDVHEIRRSLKRCRALLALAKPVINKGDFQKLDKSLGKTAKGLTRLRESSVNYQVFKAYSKKIEKYAGSECHQAIKEYLYDYKTIIYEKHAAQAHEILMKLNDTKASLTNIFYDRYSKSDLLNTIKKTYDQSKKIWEEAINSPFTKEVHDWRKLNKRLQFQVKFSSDAGILIGNDILKAITEISFKLGQDHDLAVLLEFLKLQEPFIPKESLEKLDQKMDKIVIIKRAEALKLGAQWYQVSSRNFMQQYFQ